MVSGLEAWVLPADDRDHKRKTKRPGAGKRFWSPANSQPYRQRILHGSRIDSLARECSPMFAGPVAVLVLTNLQEQIEFFCKKRTVVLQFQADQRKDADEQTPAHHHL